VQSSTNPNRDLSQTEVWFRDTLLKLLGWSGALVVLLTGWTLGNKPGTETFSFDSCISTSWFDPGCQRTIALTIGYPLLLVVWILLVSWVRKRCPEHSTVPSKRVIRLYVVAMTVISLMVLILLLV
jgi:hypothetical protein